MILYPGYASNYIQTLDQIKNDTLIDLCRNIISKFNRWEDINKFVNEYHFINHCKKEKIISGDWLLSICSGP